MARSGSLTPYFVSNDYATTELNYSTVHQEVLIWSWTTLCRDDDELVFNFL